MATIATITSIGIDKATVGLSATPDSAAVDKWGVVPVTSGAVDSCVYHILRVGATCTIYFNPPLSPSATYTLSTTTTTATVDTASSRNFATPAVTKPLGLEWPHGLLRAWSRSVSQLIQEFSGVPVTVLTQDLQPAETVIYVETTLGFPNTGYLFVGNARYRYTSRGPACFLGVTRDDPTTTAEHRRQVVYLDTSSVWPPEATLFLTTADRQYTDPNGVL